MTDLGSINMVQVSDLIILTKFILVFLELLSKEVKSG